MRDIVAASVLLGLLAIAALIPSLPADGVHVASSANASPTPTNGLPRSWKGDDKGAGFVVCLTDASWTRPSGFTSVALASDGSVSGRDAVLANAHLSNDALAKLNARTCASREPQVWLFGYRPTSYADGNPYFPTDPAMLRVKAAPGYTIVILTGFVKSQLVIASGVKLAVLEMPSTAVTPTPSRPPKPVPTMSLATPAALRPFPAATAPIDLALPATCQILSSRRHDDGAGTTWNVECGSARANRGVADLVLGQGWTRLDGPPIGVGLQNYVKKTAFGGIWMQLAWVLSGPTPFADPFVIVQYTRGYDGSPTVNVPGG